MPELLVVLCALILGYCGLLVLATTQHVQNARQGLAREPTRKRNAAFAIVLLLLAYALLTAKLSAGWAALYLLEAAAPLAWIVAVTLRKPRRWIRVLWRSKAA